MRPVVRRNLKSEGRNLKLKFEQPQKGLIESTKDRGPLKLVYYEASLNQQDATHNAMHIEKNI